MIKRIETNYPIGYWFTRGYISKIVVEIRKDNFGFNEYLLDDGKWVDGWYITCSD